MSNHQKLNTLLGAEVSLVLINRDGKVFPSIKATLMDVPGMELDLFQLKINDEAILTFHHRVCHEVEVLSKIVCLKT